MREILKHLEGDEQYLLLQKLLIDVVRPDRLPIIIQRIMDDVNK